MTDDGLETCPACYRDLARGDCAICHGDRVVTRGAYEVQLASAAKGLPAEGHVH